MANIIKQHKIKVDIGATGRRYMSRKAGGKQFWDDPLRLKEEYNPEIKTA